MHGVFYTLYKQNFPKTKNTLTKHIRIFIIAVLDEIPLMYILQCSNCDSWLITLLHRSPTVCPWALFGFQNGFWVLTKNLHYS